VSANSLHLINWHLTSSFVVKVHAAKGSPELDRRSDIKLLKKSFLKVALFLEPQWNGTHKRIPGPFPPGNIIRHVAVQYVIN